MISRGPRRGRRPCSLAAGKSRCFCCCFCRRPLQWEVKGSIGEEDEEEQKEEVEEKVEATSQKKLVVVHRHRLGNDDDDACWLSPRQGALLLLSHFPRPETREQTRGAFDLVVN
jgi:hypothetical protein